MPGVFAVAPDRVSEPGAGYLSGADFVKAVAEQQMVISSYALLARDYEIMQKISWQGIILDEAQNIKNPETMQSRAAKSLAGGFRIAMTGTPVENRLQELWSIMDFLNPGYLGNRNSFKRKFADPVERNHDERLSQQLKQAITSFVLRRQKTDKSIITELPDKIENKVYCNLLKSRRHYMRQWCRTRCRD